jgi:hypothetical protein
MNLPDCQNARNQNDSRNTAHGRDKERAIPVHHAGSGFAAHFYPFGPRPGDESLCHS